MALGGVRLDVADGCPRKGAAHAFRGPCAHRVPAVEFGCKMLAQVVFPLVFDTPFTSGYVTNLERS